MCACTCVRACVVCTCTHAQGRAHLMEKLPLRLGWSIPDCAPAGNMGSRQASPPASFPVHSQASQSPSGQSPWDPTSQSGKQCSPSLLPAQGPPLPVCSSLKGRGVGQCPKSCPHPARTQDVCEQIKFTDDNPDTHRKVKGRPSVRARSNLPGTRPQGWLPGKQGFSATLLFFPPRPPPPPHPRPFGFRAKCLRR